MVVVHKFNPPGFVMARRPTDPRAAAEAAFRPKPAPLATPPKPAGVPGARELVSIRIDKDVLELFQEDGAGWQDRINATLREAMAGRLAVASGEAFTFVEKLNGGNDDGAG